MECKENKRRSKQLRAAFYYCHATCKTLLRWTRCVRMRFDLFDHRRGKRRPASSFYSFVDAGWCYGTVELYSNADFRAISGINSTRSFHLSRSAEPKRPLSVRVRTCRRLSYGSQFACQYFFNLRSTEYDGKRL